MVTRRLKPEEEKEVTNYFNQEPLESYNLGDENWVQNNMSARDWENVSKNVALPEEFILRYKDKVDWYWICLCQNLSWDFIVQMEDYLNPYTIFKNPHLGEDIKKYLAFLFADRIDPDVAAFEVLGKQSLRRRIKVSASGLESLRRQRLKYEREREAKREEV